MINYSTLRPTAATVATLTLALGISGCGAANENPTPASADAGVTGTLNAGGSSAQQSAVAAWKRGFQTANPGATVNYDPIGSGGGREQFLSGGIAVAGSDAYLTEDELATASGRCSGDVVEVPTYVSPIAMVFNLTGADGQRIDALNLSPETIGAIFEGTITRWDDESIAAENPGADLPGSRITPVHRSDDSGTTENFTDYLDQASAGAWSGGVVETWPVKGGEGAKGTAGVISAVRKGDGTIGYADESQAGDLSTAKVKVGDTFTAVSPEAASKILDASSQVAGRSATDIAIEVDRSVTREGVYPIVLVSYQIACQSYEDPETAALAKSWLTYVTSTEGQAAAAKDAGSAPLSGAVSEKIAAAVATIQAP